MKHLSIVFLLQCATAAISLPAQSFTTLYDFGYASGPSVPTSGLTQATNGLFYGTAPQGGNGDANGTSGVVYAVNTKGALQTLYRFCPEVTQCPDGAMPGAALLQATDGNFYGVTKTGGVNGGFGTIFRMTPSGKVTTLYSFCSRTDGLICLDGAFPTTSLIQASDGNFYGTTVGGGSGVYGTVFRFSPTGVLTTIHSFCAQPGCTDGQDAEGALIQGADGNLYGTTQYGGLNGAGIVFRVTKSGTLETVYNFCAQSGCADGGNPNGALIQTADGEFYGAAAGGGLHSGGTIYKLTASGSLTTVYTFCSVGAGFSCIDGESPAGIVQGTDGAFYGTAAYGGGQYGSGTVFRLTADGNLTTLHTFCLQGDCPDGERPNTGLMQATNGLFYGTTEYGGTLGTIFSLSLGLSPFVETQTKTGLVGTRVKILGNNLTGATSVNFNGIPAYFQVPASTEIVATVPVGATSGYVVVTTPTATLSSNARFQIRH